MQNLNPYNEEEFRKAFSGSELYKKVDEYYDLVSWKKWQYEDNFKNTPRYASDHRFCRACIFYYLNKVFENKPEKVIDVGCGHNPFKKFYPNIIGLEPQTSFRDMVDFCEEFNRTWATKHTEEFNGAIAINSIHFYTLDRFIENIIMIESILKVGGRALVTANLEILSSYNSDIPRADLLSKVKERLEALPLKYLIVDIISDEELAERNWAYDDHFNGNVRIVFEK